VAVRMPGSSAGPVSQISTTSLGDAPGVVGFVSPAESSCQIGGRQPLNLPNFAGLPLALFRRPIRLGTSPSLELCSQHYSLYITIGFVSSAAAPLSSGLSILTPGLLPTAILAELGLFR
jgi:hypothetical protein